MTGTSFTATKSETKTITELLPEINEIKDRKLRQAVIKVWAKLWRESSCPDLKNAIHAGANYVDDTLIRHINAITKSALAMAQVVEEIYQTPVNYDFLIAAALLHDVDTLVMYRRKEGKLESTELRKWVPHGFYGAHVALDMGVPQEIVHAIYAHTPQTKMQPATVEGVIVAYCDMGCFLAHCAGKGKPFPDWAK